MESEVVAVLDGCVVAVEVGMLRSPWASSDAYFADGTFGNGWVHSVDASTIWRGT